MVREREREGDRARQRDREREREKETEKDKETERERERGREREGVSLKLKAPEPLNPKPLTPLKIRAASRLGPQCPKPLKRITLWLQDFLGLGQEAQSTRKIRVAKRCCQEWRVVFRRNSRLASHLMRRTGPPKL